MACGSTTPVQMSSRLISTPCTTGMSWSRVTPQNSSRTSPPRSDPVPRRPLRGLTAALNENRPIELREFPRGLDRAVFVSTDESGGGLLRLVQVDHVREPASDDVLGLVHDAADELVAGGDVVDQAHHGAHGPDAGVDVAVVEHLAATHAGHQILDVLE